MEELARVGFVARVCRRRRLHDGSGYRPLDSGHVLHGASAVEERAQAGGRVLDSRLSRVPPISAFAVKIDVWRTAHPYLIWWW